MKHLKSSKNDYLLGRISVFCALGLIIIKLILKSFSNRSLGHVTEIEQLEGP